MDNYFKSEAHRLAFAINELDGQCQMKMLGLGFKHFTSKKLAQDWRNSVLTLLKEGGIDSKTTLIKLDKRYQEIMS